MNTHFLAQAQAPRDVTCVFVDSAQVVHGLGTLPEKDQEVIQHALKNSAFSGKKNQHLTLNGHSPLYHLVGLGALDKLEKNDFTDLGGQLYAALAPLEKESATLLLPTIANEKVNNAEAAAELATGFQLRSYKFDKYKSKKCTKARLMHLDVVTDAQTEASNLYAVNQAIVEGIFLNRDLLNESPNTLNPEKFTEIAQDLEKHGLKVRVIHRDELKEKGMNAILAVGSGSAIPPRIVIMEWMNGAKDEKPLAFVGKGVTFDTGGISIKPRTKMDEMKYDMGGAAVVTSLMKTLALRKAKVNVVGLIGLAENMPDGASYRPGDIIKAYNGKTIEVVDTDAEGRIVLSDVLSYADKHYDPELIIDLATLTGAIIIALGHEYAGLFTHHDTLHTQLFEAGAKVNEKVWRLPMHPTFNKAVQSKIADLKNLVPAVGGNSITAAEFLHAFVAKDRPWVHLDIAGTAWGGGVHPLAGAMPPGYGVRLLNTFIKENYEK